MRYFCTYFDTHYLARALSLIDSLSRHCPSFRIYALCLDDNCLARVSQAGNPNVIPVALCDLEATVPNLLAVKTTRSKLEYYYTAGPSFIRYVIDLNAEIDLITYIDADLYFFADPEPLFAALGDHSIGVIGHHLPEFRKKLRVWQGIFNVGWINFRRDQNGLACLDWWKDRCLEWCYERYEDGKYADQLYLNQWPYIFYGFYEFEHHGANVAAWNASDYHFSLRNDRVYADEDPLIFYHFHGFKKISQNIYDTNLGITYRPPHHLLKRYVFAEYIAQLEKFAIGLHPTASIRVYRPRNYLIKRFARLALGIVFRQYLLVLRQRVI